MPIIIVTGSAGLIGSETVRFFAARGFDVIGIDNNMRKVFFGEEASTEWNLKRLKKDLPLYNHLNVDIRDSSKIFKIFKEYSKDIFAVIHTAAQPSHDWAAKDPFTDFSVNANGTLNLLEATRLYCPEAPFLHMSTNKVYGDRPNLLPLIESDTRWDLEKDHFFFNGIDETMSIDFCKHSLFGVSKAASDLLVQEYGRYFKMKTVCFRGGCLTGPNHSGTELHGFLSYMLKCAVTGRVYSVFGYKAKQVRDNIHSYDLVNMFWHYIQNPRGGEVYNVGGSRYSNCSILEAFSICESLTGKPMNWEYKEENRSGDHIWYISDVSKFKKHYPEWAYTNDINKIMEEIYLSMKERERQLPRPRGSGLES